MINPQRFKGRSFGWGFILFAVLFTGSAFWGQFIGLSSFAAAVILGISGLIPFAIQAVTGCALDGAWVARFSRLEHPAKYWVLLILSAAIGGGFVYGACRMYAKAASVAA